MAEPVIEFVSRRALAYDVKRDRIVARRGKRLEVRPLDACSALYGRFAELDDAPQSFAAFMVDFGPLTEDGHRDGERIDHLIFMRREIAGVVKLVADDPNNLVRLPNWKSPASYAGMLRRAGAPPVRKKIPFLLSAAAIMQAVVLPGGPDGRPTLCLQPYTLWSALRLQLYLDVSSGARLKKCDWCRNWFAAGGSGKRADARFCSDDCRVQSHRPQNGGKK